MFGSGYIQREDLDDSTASGGGRLLFIVSMVVTLSISWGVSVVISQSPHNNPIVGEVKQELRSILYSEDHGNLERLSNLPRVTRVTNDGFGVRTSLVS